MENNPRNFIVLYFKRLARAVIYALAFALTQLFLMYPFMYLYDDDREVGFAGWAVAVLSTLAALIVVMHVEIRFRAKNKDLKRNFFNELTNDGKFLTRAKLDYIFGLNLYRADLLAFCTTGIPASFVIITMFLNILTVSASAISVPLLLVLAAALFTVLNALMWLMVFKDWSS